MSLSTRVENIGPHQRRRRRVGGAWALTFATAATLASWALDTSPWLRLALSPVFLAGFLGVLQARERT